MKLIIVKIMAVLVVALFVFTPTVTAAGPGGGGAGDGGGLTCGYLSYLEPCDATGDTDRIKCAAKWGGSSTCTIENCNGLVIPLTGPLSGCV